jgi:hypothetical protein
MNDYKDGYSVVDQRQSGPECPLIGRYGTLTQAHQVAAHHNGACVLRTVGDHYDLSEASTVSRLVQKVGVLPNGQTYRWPA